MKEAKPRRYTKDEACQVMRHHYHRNYTGMTMKYIVAFLEERKLTLDMMYKKMIIEIDEELNIKFDREIEAERRELSYKNTPDCVKDIIMRKSREIQYTRYLKEHNKRELLPIDDLRRLQSRRPFEHRIGQLYMCAYVMDLIEEHTFIDKNGMKRYLDEYGNKVDENGIKIVYIKRKMIV